MPQVDAHNDLTMANILLDDDGGMGIIDWETGKARALPLVDFFYAITDAVRIACGWADRLDAFRACFAADGVYAPAVARLQARLAAVVNMSADMAELCFHACWLHHAANEHRSSHASEPRPFLRIVQWLALHKAEAGERRV
jgi:aminoglycoside phosphotransferase (APT) family kinase protein